MTTEETEKGRRLTRLDRASGDGDGGKSRARAKAKYTDPLDDLLGTTDDQTTKGTP